LKKSFTQFTIALQNDVTVLYHDEHLHIFKYQSNRMVMGTSISLNIHKTVRLVLQWLWSMPQRVCQKNATLLLQGEEPKGIGWAITDCVGIKNVR
jgi:hypothetical protein